MSEEPVLKIAFLDVGQGDTIVVSAPDTHEAVVVDCVDSVATLGYLQSEHVNHLRGLIVTHLHADHYRGVVELLENCEREVDCTCEQVIFNWPSARKQLKVLLQDSDLHSRIYAEDKQNNRVTKNIYDGLKLWANQHVDRAKPLEVGTTHIGGDIGHTIQVLQPYHGQMGVLQQYGLNNLSGVLRIRGPKSTVLLTGDIEPQGWRELQSRNGDLKCDVLKFPHHGAWKDGDADALLDSVQPSIVVISVGTEGDKFDHPNPNVLQALRKRSGVRLLCTEATSKCQKDAANKRDSTLGEHVGHLRAQGRALIASRHGCPCAGTVVIDLADKPRVILPEIDFHQRSVIVPHLTGHKCVIS